LLFRYTGTDGIAKIAMPDLSQPREEDHPSEGQHGRIDDLDKKNITRSVEASMTCGVIHH
jgi:hypothetical protein